MTTLQKIFTCLIFTTVFSCNNTTTNKTDTTKTDSTISNWPDSNPVTNKPHPVVSDDEGKKTTIAFRELSVSINGYTINDKDDKLEQVQKDTVTIQPELGERIEGKILSVSNNELTNLRIEQRYQTSVTIMNEGAHCDLTEWKHYYSDWQVLPTNNHGKFTSYQYTEAERKKFPPIIMEELKQKVKEHCGAEFHPLVEKIKSTTDYPGGVNISRYFFKITGQRKDNGQPVTKLIVVETPMGD